MTDASSAGTKPPSDDASRPEVLLDSLQLAFREAVRRKIRQDLEAEAASAAKLRRERVPLVKACVEALRADGRCGAVWLFGSYAWGQPSLASDLDVLVDGDADELAWRLGNVEGLRHLTVDAWRLEAAPPELVRRAQADGIPL